MSSIINLFDSLLYVRIQRVPVLVKGLQFVCTANSLNLINQRNGSKRIHVLG